MQIRPRYALMRRILFPYSGEEPLSLKQALRVVLAWSIVFPLPLSFCVLALAFTIGEASSLQELARLFVFSFLSGAFIFGLLSVLIVSMTNRAARIHQAWKARRGQQ